MVYQNILEAIGHTPMVQLNKMADPDGARILVKFEGLGVGGSIKTRTAYNMILDAERRGLIHKDTVIVEPTSGNQGIGLALVGAVRGYKTVIVMPDSVSEERRKLVHHYGAEVILIHDAGNIGDCIEECLNTALRMREENPNVYIPQQFENPANPTAHRHHTAQGAQGSASLATVRAGPHQRGARSLRRIHRRSAHRRKWKIHTEGKTCSFLSSRSVGTVGCLDILMLWFALTHIQYF